jgi:hypothetical protein
MAPCILNFDTRWRIVVNFMPWKINPQGRSPKYPMHRRFGGIVTTLWIIS